MPKKKNFHTIDHTEREDSYNLAAIKSEHFSKKLTSISDISQSEITNKSEIKNNAKLANSTRKKVGYPFPVHLMRKRLKSENKEKLAKRLMDMNSKLDPQFRLSKIDLEDVVNVNFQSHFTSLVQPQNPEVSLLIIV